MNETCKYLFQNNIHGKIVCKNKDYKILYDTVMKIKNKIKDSILELNLDEFATLLKLEKN